MIEIADKDHQLLARLADGLPLVSRPYAEMGAELGLSEDDVIARLRHLVDSGIIRRFGLIVRHHELGYRSGTSPTTRSMPWARIWPPTPSSPCATADAASRRAGPIICSPWCTARNGPMC